MSALVDVLRPSQRLAVLLAGALVGATAGLVTTGASHVAVFFVAGLGLADLAALFGDAIEQLGERVGPGATGLLQSSLGNLPELLVAVFALRAGLTGVVQAALVGSVLANVLLVLGLAFLVGGMKHGTQRFDPEAPRMIVTLLTLAAGAALVPTLAAHLDTPAVRHTAALSDATAIVLLVVYVVSIPFWLGGGPQASSDASDASGGARRSRPARTLPPEQLWPLGLALVVLAAASVASGTMSDWFVSSLTPATKALGISPVFTGLVIVAIASNAVENAAGIRFALKPRPDYAISTILNSPLQVTLFLVPVLVLVSPLLGPAQLTLVFPPLLVAALAISIVVVGVVIYDGEYSWLEGAALIALYAIVGAAFWWG